VLTDEGVSRAAHKSAGPICKTNKQSTGRELTPFCGVIMPSFVRDGNEMRAFVMNVASCFGFAFGTGLPAVAAIPPPDSPVARHEAQQLDQLPAVAPSGKAQIDHSGRKQKGNASYYSSKFEHRRMADGNHMNPQANVAASKNLPLGTTATVINLQNGRSSMVRVEDRGPFAAGRVMDVTPKVAQELEMKKRGVALVEVKPIAVPQPNGEVRLGAGAATLTPQQVQQATRTTLSLAYARR
jgi:rare lipoprotein A